MKKIIISVLFIAVFFPVNLLAQDNEDKLNLPGDNLNLYAVLKLFQESETLESFENKLNDENSEINNLDLNGDDQTDYIKVIDDVDGDVHTIVLQTDISATEKQDIAVITVQKDPDGKVQIQLIGDEELYGKDYIIEPNAEDNMGGTPNPGYTGNKKDVHDAEAPPVPITTTVIAAWPVVQYMYLPAYTIWHSPWYWSYYPTYWHPWRPLYWHAYWGYHSNLYGWYHNYYRRWPVYRYPRWNTFYFNTRRVRSVVVVNRRQNGLYRATYGKPQTKQEGITLFNKRNPGGNRLPGDAGVQKPALQPERPVTRPGMQKPVTRPERPAPRPDVQKPIVRPVQPERPVTKPMRPVVQRPVTRPVQQKPVQHQPNDKRREFKDKRGG